MPLWKFHNAFCHNKCIARHWLNTACSTSQPMSRFTVSNLASYRKSLATRCTQYGQLNAASYLCTEEHSDELLPSEWYRKACPKLIKLSDQLKNVEQIDGRLIDTNDGSIIRDTNVISQMQEFKLIAKAFIGSPSMQHPLRKAVSSCSISAVRSCFSKPSERNSMVLNSLTTACNFLGVSAQQRKIIRFKVCPQVTQHHIWRGSLEEVIKNLKADMDALKYCSKEVLMGQQIVSSCIRFFSDTEDVSSSESPSWMRPAPFKKVEMPLLMRRWEEVLEMFVDLSKCLKQVEMLACHVAKLEAMQEGLSQIKDILVERDIAYKEVQRQDCLVQKKLSKYLGHSSKCLFTLLLYYLYGSVRDIEVDVQGSTYRVDGSKTYVCIGRILTSCNDEMVWNGIKQLSRALGLFKFVWETAGMKGVLELQGHLWCLGAEDRILKYRDNEFFLHAIKL